MPAQSMGAVLKNSAILLVQCPDRKGVNATIADSFIAMTATFFISNSTRSAKKDSISPPWNGTSTGFNWS
jgi:hypothetical protein